MKRIFKLRKENKRYEDIQKELERIKRIKTEIKLTDHDMLFYVFDRIDNHSSLIYTNSAILKILVIMMAGLYVRLFFPM